jgi:TatD DNase family protein
VIHSRSADDDIAAMIRDTDARCILHSFSSGERVLRAGLDRDAYFSFSGMITFKSWKGVDAVQAVPTERLLVETDAPYLAPVPHRGQRNEPAFVVRVAERLAELRGSTVEDMISSTTANAVRLFGDRVTQSTITP